MKKNLFLFLDSFFFKVADRKYLISRGQITLSCENLVKTQQGCKRTVWLFGRSKSTLELVYDGQIQSHKPGRLSLSENCSLTIKNLRDEDAGLYACRQFNSAGAQIREDADFGLSVVTSESFHHILLSPPLNHEHHFSGDVVFLLSFSHVFLFIS